MTIYPSRLVGFGGVVLCALAACGCGVRAQAFTATGTLDRTLQVGGPVTLSIRTGSGSIRIREGAVDRVHVIGSIRAYSGVLGASDPRTQVKKFSRTRRSSRAATRSWSARSAISGFAST